jgi:hypothetical protein
MTRRQLALVVTLSLLTIPAVAISFFVTCLATFGITGLDSTFPDAPLIVGSIFALIAGASMVYLMWRVARSGLSSIEKN